MSLPYSPSEIKAHLDAPRLAPRIPSLYPSVRIKTAPKGLYEALHSLSRLLKDFRLRLSTRHQLGGRRAAVYARQDQYRIAEAAGGGNHDRTSNHRWPCGAGVLRFCLDVTAHEGKTMNEQMNATELAALKAAIEELPPKTKMALLRVREGASYEEVGAELKMRTWKVRRLVERAMDLLLERVS